MTKPAELPAYEGRKVRRATVRITNAGDGLSEALKVDPKPYFLDNEVFFVLKGRVAQVNHKSLGDDADDLERVHTVKAMQIVEVQRKDIQSFLDEQAERLQSAKDEAAGQESILNVPGVVNGKVADDDE